MSDKVITSYKAFGKNMQCRNFQYEVGKEYEMDGEIKCLKTESSLKLMSN